MHLHILGICGTFMGGIATLARSLGHRVTGSDSGVYPPMSTLLESQGIALCELDDLSQFDDTPDLVIIGNALSRGKPAVEYVLDRNIPYTSGPEWLKHNVLQQRWVLAVAGTHGKTTTTSMLAWILEHAGLEPGFLIGGVAPNFQASARLGKAPFFVIEADEYDTAFFDKRAKCVHYLPKTLVLNNLEYDHADIYPNLEAIQTQLHHAVRTVPSHGCVLSHQHHQAVQQVLEKGCWSDKRTFGQDWSVEALTSDASRFVVKHVCGQECIVEWSLFGQHNMHNAAMAIAAAHHAGVAITQSAQALAEFENVKRRMELRGTVNNIRVYDDFAHHPTAIATTLQGLRSKITKGRILAIIEPRSNTMKMGIHKHTLNDSWQHADAVWLKTTSDMQWIRGIIEPDQTTPVTLSNSTSEIVEMVSKQAQPDDHIVVMSNGGFDGIHGKLLSAL